MNRKNEALRWLKEAQEELKTANVSFNGKRFSAACFWSQQAVEKSLKSFLFFNGSNMIFEYSLEALIKECKKYDSKFSAFYKAAKMLDKYYIPTRYPNGLPYPAVPSLFYDKDEAKQAIEVAEKMINFVKNKLKLEAE